MKPESNIEMIKLMAQLNLSARLEVKDAAQRLKFTQSDIATLVGAKLLKPLGKPAPNAAKYFSTVQVLTLACDEEWLNQATRCCSEYWKSKRRRRKSGMAVAAKTESA